MRLVNAILGALRATNDNAKTRLDDRALQRLLGPLLAHHGYPSDAARDMTIDVSRGARVVPAILELVHGSRWASDGDAPVVACLLAAAFAAQGRMTTQRLHVALSLMESLAHEMRPNPTPHAGGVNGDGRTRLFRAGR